MDKERIGYAKNAVKYIESLDRPTKQQIKAGIEGLAETPKRRHQDPARLSEWQETVKDRKIQNHI